MHIWSYGIKFFKKFGIKSTALAQNIENLQPCSKFFIPKVYSWNRFLLFLFSNNVDRQEAHNIRSETQTKNPEDMENPNCPQPKFKKDSRKAQYYRS